ncbi:signal transducing kinase of the PAK, partial [Lobosporangium transversale]
IEEDVLPQKYQRIITHDINRILRELAGTGDKKDSAGLTPSSPMLYTNGHSIINGISHLTLDNGSGSPHSFIRSTSNLYRKTSNADWATTEEEIPFKEYSMDAPIEDLVNDTAMAYHRGPDKANEWLAKLKNQDIMTIGDLKDLQDSDWAGFDLTVFASRALRNRLFGKRPNILTRSSSNGVSDDGNL